LLYPTTVVDEKLQQKGTTFLWRLLKVLRTMKDATGGCYKIVYKKTGVAKVFLSTPQAVYALKAKATDAGMTAS
jgi:hypothetical protein